jgi:hypothetical protein
MESVHQEVGTHPRVHISSVEGDLRVSGRAGTRLEAQAGSRGGLLVQPHGDLIEVSSRSGCLLFLPEGSLVEVGRASGDARVADLTGELRVHDIGGDLSLRRVGPVRIDHVSGDLVARRISGSLHAQEVEGDARLEQVNGAVTLEKLGGGLRATQVEGNLELRVAGDAWLDWLPPAAGSSSVRAEGDVVCRFLASTSAKVTGHANGEVRMLGERGGTTVTLGAGEAAVDLWAGGDLLVTHGGTEFAAGLAEEISAQVEATLADVEAGLEGMDLSDYGVDTQDLRHKVHHALSRALRRARPGGGEAPEGASTPETTDEERLAILHMLEDGKINVDQAESLLRALEQGG